MELEVLHGTWVPNEGKIYVWYESAKGICIPTLEDVMDKAIKQARELAIVLPTQKGEVLPSLSMARQLNIEYPESFTWEVHKILCNTIDVKNLRDLVLQENTRFAPDILFWKNMLGRVSEIIEKDLYIPGISEDNKPIWISHHPELKVLSEQMPNICCYIEQKCYEKESLLQHFFDYTINQIASRVSPSTAIQRSIADTLLEKHFLKKENCTFVEKENWYIWKSALDKTKHDVCFQLEAPDHTSKNWHMNLLVQNSDSLAANLSSMETVFNRFGTCASYLSRVRSSFC